MCNLQPNKKPLINQTSAKVIKQSRPSNIGFYFMGPCFSKQRNCVLFKMSSSGNTTHTGDFNARNNIGISMARVRFWGTPNFRLISNSNCLEVTGMSKHVNASFRSVFGTFRKVMIGPIDRLLVRRMASIDFSCLVVNKSSRGAQFPPQSFLFSEKLLHLVVEV